MQTVEASSPQYLLHTAMYSGEATICARSSIEPARDGSICRAGTVDAADGLGEKAYLDIESRGRWVIGNCARPTSVGRVVRGCTQEDMGLVTKARHDARDGGLRSELGLRARRMGDAGERWGSGREEGEHCGDGNAQWSTE